MTTTTLAQETAFKDAVALSENTLQGDIGTAKATLTGSALQIALDVAHRNHHDRVSEAATLNNMTSKNVFAHSHSSRTGDYPAAVSREPRRSGLGPHSAAAQLLNVGREEQHGIRRQHIQQRRRGGQ